jgi:ATP-dependent exoDNAse (exonuclease V) beta subunit
MTVHKAKGLEFPVVILVDPTAPPTARQPSRYIDPEKKLWAMPLAGCSPVELLERRDEVLRHDREESVRVAYVAATRAREMLVVPAVGDSFLSDESAEGWLDVLHPVIFPKPIDRRRSEAAPGCPPFGEDSVAFRPESVDRGAEGSVRPGLHKPEAGGHRVVWWDPRALELDKTDDVGLRQQRILAADEGGVVAIEGEKLHAEWQSRRASLLERGSVPSLRVATVTELKDLRVDLPVDPPIDVRSEATPVARTARPHGKRFGILVHAVLSMVDLAADAEALGRAARAEGRLLAATEEEVKGAAAAAEAALGHALLVRARKASACRRETPMVLAREDGSLVEGVLDLAFRETEGGVPVWTVVDFKTDVEIVGRREAYEQQVGLYAKAVSAATGEKARGVLLSV